MQDGLREKLSSEITRKQFLKYIAGALLMVFGLDNFISLLTTGTVHGHDIHKSEEAPTDGFGSRKFGE